MTSRAIVFHWAYPPHQPGDVAGFPQAIAEGLVARRIAEWADRLPEPPVDFDAMSRDQLLGHAAKVLGLTEAPPEDVSDADLREALKAHAVGMPVPPAEPVEPGPSVDQLDALDRLHLEAFATTKAGFTEIDPALSDDELRDQIRAVFDASVSAAAPAPTGKKRRA